MQSCSAAPYTLQIPEWFVFLRTVCVVVEGAAELVVGPRSKSRHKPYADAAACVAAMLSDTENRVAAMGGREGMPRSLGSVYSGSITRFLGGFRGGASRASRVHETPSVESSCNGMAVSSDGLTLLVSDVNNVLAFRASDGVFLNAIGSHGNGPLQFCGVCQVWVASDGYVFVAECSNDRIQVLTPQYDFHSFVRDEHLIRPSGVCANNDVIVVSQFGLYHCISVFSRTTATLIRRFEGQLFCPAGVCFMSGDRHVAVADSGNKRASVYTLEGDFVRHVGVGILFGAEGIACSAADELAVADNRHIMVFSACGEIVWTSEAGDFSGVAIRGSTIFGQTAESSVCYVFS